MRIENPEYNPICVINRFEFVIQKMNGCRNRYYNYFCSNYGKDTGFKKQQGVSGAEYIKRK